MKYIKISLLFLAVFLSAGKLASAEEEPASRFSLGASMIFMQQEFELEKLELKPEPALPFDLNSVGIAVGDIEAENNTFTFRPNAWLAPFFNLYGIVGYSKGETKTTATVPESLLEIVEGGVPGMTPCVVAGNCRDLQLPVSFDYEGPTLGVGAVLAYGSDRIFTTLDVNYTQTELDISDSSIEAFTISPRVGYTTADQRKGAIWLGAMYQEAEKKLTGTFEFSGLEVPYEIEQEAKTDWNYLLGGHYNLDEIVDFTAEIGFGERQHVMLRGAFSF